LDLRTARQLFSSRDLRNGALGLIVVVGGLTLSALTMYAHRTGDARLTGIMAGLSLLSVLLILIFVVPPLARNAGREASQLNLPFEFTAGGAIFLVLVIIVGFSAWNTGNNLLFLILAFLLSSLIVGFIAGSLCLKKLDVRMRFPETIFAGEATPLLVGITNRKRLFPAFSIIVEVRGKEREKSIVAPELDRILPSWAARRLSRAPIVSRTLDHFEYVPTRGESEARTEHRFPNRGRLVIKHFELSTKFPFGFFRHRRRLPAREAELIVFPRLIDVSGQLDDLPAEVGNRATGKRGAGQDLLALRDYRPHDDLRSIDWKATARTRNLTVREFAADEEKSITVVLDTRLPLDAINSASIRERMADEQAGKPVVVSKRFETGASLAASLLLRFFNENSTLCLAVNGDLSESDMGRQHLYELLKRLAFCEPEFASEPERPELTSSIRRILDETTGGHIFLVTAADDSGLPPDIREQLNIVRF
jgi:hypothetical protein